MREASTLKGEKLIVLTEAEYNELIEDAGDAALADAAAFEKRGAPTLPADLLERSLDGRMHPLTAWRKAVGMTQAALARKAGLRTATVGNIENGKIDPRLSSLKALADALNLDIDDIVD
ncbi:MAG: helix-turn-helix transcriptional regulator [Pseudomonadota bacterium]